jgi:hypothetical protein
MTNYQPNVTAAKLSRQPPSGRFREAMAAVWRRRTAVIAVLAATAIAKKIRDALQPVPVLAPSLHLDLFRLDHSNWN